MEAPAPATADAEAPPPPTLIPLLACPDVLSSILAFTRVGDMARLAWASRQLHRLLLPSAPSSSSSSSDGSAEMHQQQYAWRHALAAALARYGLPALLAAGGWAAGRRLVTLAPVGPWRSLPPHPIDDDNDGPLVRLSSSGMQGTALCVDADAGRLLAFGGAGPDGAGGSGLGNGTWEWSEAGGWRALPIRSRAPQLRSHADAACVRVNRGQTRALVVFGGELREGFRYNDLWLLELGPAGNGDERAVAAGGASVRTGLMWVKISNGGPDNPPPRTRHSFTATNDALVVFGGLDSHTGAPLRDAWVYDLKFRGRWAKVPTNGRTAPSARWDHVACAVPLSCLAPAAGCGGQEQEQGVLVAGGRASMVEEEAEAVAMGALRPRLKRGERRVFVLDTLVRRWREITLQLRPLRNRGDDDDVYFDFADLGRLLPLAHPPGVVVGLGRQQSHGIVILHLRERWWRRLPGPPGPVSDDDEDAGARSSSLPAAAVVGHGHLICLWPPPAGRALRPYLRRWFLPLCVGKNDNDGEEERGWVPMEVEEVAESDEGTTRGVLGLVASPVASRRLLLVTAAAAVAAGAWALVV